MAITSLILRLTEQCNLRYAYCYAALPGRRVPDMSQALAIQAVRACCPEGGSLDVQFTGGEPLLAQPVMEAVYAFGKETERKLRLAVQTNATLLSPDVCRRLAAIHCAVGVSLDGMAVSNALRVFPNGSPSFTAAVEGIRNLGQCGIRCGMTAVVTSVSAPYLGRLPDLAMWLGNVDGVGLDLFRPPGAGGRAAPRAGAGGTGGGIGGAVPPDYGSPKDGLPVSGAGAGTDKAAAGTGQLQWPLLLRPD